MTVLLNTAANKQQLAATVLDEILSMPLAAGDCSVRRNGTIEIRLPDHNGTDWCTEVEKYAASLGLGLRQLPMPLSPGWVTFEACGHYRGVYVSVWTPQGDEDRKAWGR